METDRAKEIIKALADGVDPYTGERFPADGPYQRADTVRALHTALEALSKVKAPRPKDPTKPKAGAAWTPEEEQQVKDAFQAKTPIADIARQLGRTEGAITARLVKLGLIDPNTVPRPGQGNTPPHQSPASGARLEDDETPF